jgi:hypothetical protein
MADADPAAGATTGHMSVTFATAECLQPATVCSEAGGLFGLANRGKGAGLLCKAVVRKWYLR